MKHIPRFAVVFVVLVIICSLAGCGRDARLRGKWVFDREFTEAQQPKPKEAFPAEKEKNPLGAMQEGLAAMIIPTLLEKLDGAHLTITAKEMAFTTKDGTGQSETYEIIERPTADTWRVKKKDGSIETYTRTGDRLMLPATGNIDLKVYFKPAGK